MRRLIDLVEGKLPHDEQEAIHGDALRRTGFWGAQGAGCVFLARTTGRLLLCHRSRYVEQPGTWGNWGGAIDHGESPEEAVQREAREETGHPGPFEALPLYVFKSASFRYYNFLVDVEEEFHPHESWESQGYAWIEWGDWPEPLHFGLKALFSDPDSVRTITSLIEKFTSDLD